MTDPQVLSWLAVGSAAMFLSGLLLVPVVVVRLPHDFFVREPDRPRRHPVLNVIWHVVKNVVGVVLVAAGVAMLVLPGQGLLTIIVGLCLVDVPGRRELVRRILEAGPVRRSIDVIRERAGVPPLQLEATAAVDSAETSTPDEERDSTTSGR